MSGLWPIPTAWIVFITGKADTPAGEIMGLAMIVIGEIVADMFSQGMTGINIDQQSVKHDPIRGDAEPECRVGLHPMSAGDFPG